MSDLFDLAGDIEGLVRQTSDRAGLSEDLTTLLPSPLAPFELGARRTSGYPVPANAADQIAGAAPGSLPGSSLIPGSVTGEVFAPGASTPPDVTPPAVPTLVSISSDLVQETIGGASVRITALVIQPGDSDLLGTIVELTAQLVGGLPDFTNPATIWIPVGRTTGAWPGASGNTTYYARAYAIDTSGNKSAYTGTYSTTSAKDAQAPEIPTGLYVIPAFRALGLSWIGTEVTDLAFYQVRWKEDGGTYTEPVQTRASVFVTPPTLDPAKLYWIQVRAIDRSGNVDDGTGVAVDYIANPEAGWADAVSETPLLIGSPDIAAGAVFANFVDTDTLTASAITTGTLILKAADAVAAIELRDSDPNPLARWDADGLTIYDPAYRTTRWLRLTSAELQLVASGIVQTAITPDGIDAAAIRFGVMGGGQNLLFNSSFELSPPVATNPYTADTQADFTADQKAIDNATLTAGGLITVTSWTPT